MSKKISLDAKYGPSENIVARDVQGEFVIIPITSGVGDLEDEIFSLNASGRAIWDRLDTQKTLGEVIKDLGSEFESTGDEIEKDVLGITGELLKRKMLVEIK